MKKAQDRLASWMRSYRVMESSHIRVMRVADNMHNVAVTDGDKGRGTDRIWLEVDAIR